MKKRLFLSILLGSILYTTNSIANPQEQISAEDVYGAIGAKKITLHNPEDQTLVEIGYENPSDAPEDLQLYSITNYSSVLALESQGTLPTWFVEEFLVEHGVTRQEILGGQHSDVTFNETVNINQLANEAYLRTLEQQDPNSDFSLSCKAKWYDKSKRVNRTSEPLSKTYTKADTTGDFTGSVDSKLSASTYFDLNVKYQIRQRECLHIPYNARYVSATLEAKIEAHSDTNVKAQYVDEFKKNLFTKNFGLWSYSSGVWVSIVYIGWDFNLDLKLGADIDAKIKAAAEGSLKIDGIIHKKWVCDTEKCDKYDLDNNQGITVTSPAPSYSIEGDLTLNLFTELTLNAKVDVYQAIDVVKAGAGLHADLPARYFFYIGNQCSDADGDGENEHLNAQILDITPQLYGFLEYKLIGGSWKYNPFSLKPSGWATKEIMLPNRRDPNKKIEHTVAYKNVYFKNLDGGEELFQPVINLTNSSLSQNANVTFSKRSCYPLPDEPFYNISWGDGSQDLQQKPGTISHSFTATGNLILEVQVNGDTQGRDLGNKSTTKLINVGINGEGGNTAPQYTWLIPVTSLLLN